ncbi:prepilin-type N-terminal cleavage/methylation domain-containing protein [Gemelliphila asaccharolytica]|uniref:Prepilin-type cleavage/methylation protein n=1 Tax=Gemelliphila asaccharolytica TaxID=502393 RepID=A0ABR5TN59_9BACL|nr:prepilin-type N-terminal cleavage/methylation domain-containing protein [Gemella asaccharolytica]KXB58822.1 prepilin-type cleavage/methylation protein [Gemella asaccharolytica]
MEKQEYKNNKGFSFIETIGVLFIVSIVITILAYNPVNKYEKYKERLAVNEIVSDIYLMQTKSLTTKEPTFIKFYEKSNEYLMKYDGKFVKKNVKEQGKTGVGMRALDFRYTKGNVNISNTVLVMFKHSKYEIIIHLETGYITVNEKK